MVLDGISENMASVVKSGIYGANNIDGTTKRWILCYSIYPRVIHDKNNTTIDGQVISDGKLVVKEKYL